MLYDTKYRLDKNKKCRIKTKKETFYETSLHFAVPNGLEPSTSCVTGRHSNQTELRHHYLKEPFKTHLF